MAVEIQSPPESPGTVGAWAGEGGRAMAWRGRAGAAGLPLQGWEVWGFGTTAEKTGSGEWTNTRNR